MRKSKLLAALLAMVALSFTALSCSSESGGEGDETQTGGETVVTKGAYAVRSVSSVASSASVVLAWLPPDDTSNYGGVKITWGSKSEFVDSVKTSYTVTGLFASTSYTFTITTLDSAKNETSSSVTLPIATPAAQTGTEYVNKNYAAAVTFTATKNDNNSVSVAMTSATDGAAIYYTTDGTEPTVESALYAEAIEITEDTSFTAFAVKEGLESSPFSYANVTITEKTVTKTEYVGKTYASAVSFTATETENGMSVSMKSATDDAVIYYTTDGTTPTTESTVYAGAVNVSEDAEFIAFAAKDGIENSPMSYAKVSISEKTVTDTVYENKTYADAVIFTTEDASEGVSVSMRSATEGATIYYTTDGTTPIKNSAVYTQSINVSKSTTLKAIAVKNGIEDSPVSSARITIKVDESTVLCPVTAVVKSTSVVLSWEELSDVSDFGGVKITWGSDGSAVVAKGTTSYTVTGLSEETEYTFVITTLDSSLNETSSSIELSVTTASVEIKYIEKETAASLTVGSKVMVGNETYYVVSNQLSTNSAARAAVTNGDEDSVSGSANLSGTEAAEAINTGDTTTDIVIEKFASDVYVRKILKEVGITKYIQLYNAESRPAIKISSTNSNSYLVDDFLIADENGNKIAEFSQRFASNQFVRYYKKYVDRTVTASDTKSMGEYMYSHFTADELRENYEPAQFDVTTYENGVSKYKISKVYKYDKNGEVATTKANLDHVSYYRHPAWAINNGKYLYPYVYQYFDYTDGTTPYEKVQYVLCNTNGSQNYSLSANRYTNSEQTVVTVNASGTSASDTSSSNRKNTIDIYFNMSSLFMYIDARLYDSSTSSYGTDTISATGETSKRIIVYLYSLDATKTNLLEQNVNAVVNGTTVYADESNTEYTLEEALSAYLSDYIQVSSDTTTVSGYTVPAKLYVRANFSSSYGDVYGRDFLNVVLVPVESKDNNGNKTFKYISIYDSNGAEAFDSCVAKEAAIEESDYVPSFATLYKDNYASVMASTYSDTTDNPFVSLLYRIAYAGSVLQYVNGDELESLKTTYSLEETADYTMAGTTVSLNYSGYQKLYDKSVIETFNTESSVMPTTSVTGSWDFSVYNENSTSLPGGVAYNKNYKSTAFPVALADSALGTQTGAALSIIGGAGIKWKNEGTYNYGLYTQKPTGAKEQTYTEYYQENGYVEGKLSLVLSDTADVTLSISGNGDAMACRWVVVTDDGETPAILGAGSYLARHSNSEINCIKELSLKKLPAGTYYIWMCGSCLNKVEVDNSSYLGTSDTNVGKIVLADGTLAAPSSYTAIDTSNPPVAVVAYEKNGKSYGVGLHTSSSLDWAPSGTTGYNTTFTDIVCTPSSTGYVANTATFTGDPDGSDNWSVICSVDLEGSADAATNYPAFNWVNTYGETYAGKLGSATDGWYMPSLAELCYVYRNRETINATLSAINGIDSSYAQSSLGTSYFWSSSQYSDDYNSVWGVGFDQGDVNYYGKFYNDSVLVVRAF